MWADVAEKRERASWRSWDPLALLHHVSIYAGST